MVPVALLQQWHLRGDALLAALVASSGDAIIAMTPEGLVVSWNGAAEVLLGYSAQAVLGRNVVSLFPADRAEELSGVLERVGKGETVRGLKVAPRGEHRQGTTLSITASPIFGPDSSVLGVSMIARDVTKYVQAAAALHAAERSAARTLSTLDTLQATAPIGFLLVDRDFRYVRVNEKMALINGAPIGEHIGRTVAEIVPELWPKIEPVYRHILASGEAVLDVEMSGDTCAEPGTLRHWLMNFYPVRVASEIIGIGVVVVDITERKHAEALQGRMTRGAVAALASMAEARDPYTAGHQRRVADIAASIAVELGLSADEVEGIEVAASIHDIGKVSIPAEILSRPTQLRPAELELVRGHPQAGSDIAAEIMFPWAVPEMILQHHERFDGSGYPYGLQGEEIILGARIIGVADTVEAMSAHRPYRSGLGLEAALLEIEKGRGTLFDPQVVDVCLRLHREGRILLRSDDPAGPPKDGRPSRDP